MLDVLKCRSLYAKLSLVFLMVLGYIDIKGAVQWWERGHSKSKLNNDIKQYNSQNCCLVINFVYFEWLFQSN